MFPLQRWILHILFLWTMLTNYLNSFFFIIWNNLVQMNMIIVWFIINLCVYLRVQCNPLSQSGKVGTHSWIRKGVQSVLVFSIHSTYQWLTSLLLLLQPMQQLFPICLLQPNYFSPSVATQLFSTFSKLFFSKQVLFSPFLSQQLFPFSNPATSPFSNVLQFFPMQQVT